MEEFLFTTAGLLEFLLSIDELSDKDIDVSETGSMIEVHIGDSVYKIKKNSASDVDVDSESLDEISEIAEQAMDEVYEADASGEYETSLDTVESGIIKELAKTLMIGGLVRLTSDAIKKS